MDISNYTMTDIARIPGMVTDSLEGCGHYMIEKCGFDPKEVIARVVETDSYGAVSVLSAAGSGYLCVDAVAAAFKLEGTKAVIKGAESLGLSIVASVLNQDASKMVQSTSFTAGALARAVVTVIACLGRNNL